MLQDEVKKDWEEQLKIPETNDHQIKPEYWSNEKICFTCKKNNSIITPT